MPNRPDPALKETNFPEYQRQAREWRAYIGQRQKEIDTQLAYGASLSDLGIFNQKEMGQAGWRRRMILNSYQGYQDPNWTYDWVNGVKYHTGTSDETQHGIPVPISASERREFETQKRYGNNEGDYIKRLQAEQIGSMQQKAREGAFVTDPRYPQYYWDDTRNKYFDQYGAVVDPATGRRIGGTYEDPNWNPQFSGGGGGANSGPIMPAGGGAAGGAGGYGAGYPGGASGAGGYGSYSNNGLLLGSPSLEGLAANEASISAELAKQGRLDTLGKLFEYTRAANQYNQALPQQKYLRDFYGSILGVSFQPGQQTDYGKWFSQGVNQQGGYYGSMPGSGNPYQPGYHPDPTQYDPNGTLQGYDPYFDYGYGPQIPGGHPGPTQGDNGPVQIGPGGLPHPPVPFTGPASPMASSYTNAYNYPAQPPSTSPPTSNITAPTQAGPSLPTGPGPAQQAPGDTIPGAAGPSFMTPEGGDTINTSPPTRMPPEQPPDELKGEAPPKVAGDRIIPIGNIHPGGPRPNDLPPHMTGGVGAQYIPGQSPATLGTYAGNPRQPGYLGPPVTNRSSSQTLESRPWLRNDGGYLGPPVPGMDPRNQALKPRQGYLGPPVPGDQRNQLFKPRQGYLGPPVPGDRGGAGYLGPPVADPMTTKPGEVAGDGGYLGPPTLSGIMKKGGGLPHNPGDNDFPPKEYSFMTPTDQGASGAGQTFGGGPTPEANGLVPKSPDALQMAIGGAPAQQSLGGGPTDNPGAGSGGDSGPGINSNTGYANEPVPPELWYAWIPWRNAHPGSTFADFLGDPVNGPVLERWITDQQHGGQSPNGYNDSIRDYLSQQPGFNGNYGWNPPGSIYPNGYGQGQQQWYRPISPDLPQAPQFDEGSYTLTGNSFNPMDSSTWGFLAKGAGQIAGDADNAAEQIRRTVPAGGARDKALAQLAQGKFAGVAGLRQDLTNSALSGISGLTEAGLGYSPGQLTGGAQSLGNIFSNKYATDANSASNAANLAENQRQFNLTLQNQQKQQRSGLFGGLARGLGNLFAQKAGLGNIFGG